MSLDYDELPLGKKTPYLDTYTPSLLCAVPRWDGREELEIDPEDMPFRGVDYWNAYEVSWLTPSGKPTVAIAEFHVPCYSKNLVESKSLKLYLNSLNQTVFETRKHALQTLENDLTIACGAPVVVKLHELGPQEEAVFKGLPGESLDHLQVKVDDFGYDASTLENDVGEVTESLFTNLFRSLCPVTGQPDWATILVRYSGRRINHEGLLTYLLSFRREKGFHEQCIERIFMDIKQRCAPRQLTVYGRFCRRGGLDINPFRSNYEEALPNIRLIRQ